MENLSLPPPTDCSNELEQSTPHQLTFAMERARLLFGCYRMGEANDPETYVAAVTKALALFPQDTIKFVTDPSTGMPSRLKWMPSVAEVIEACNDHDGLRRRIAEMKKRELNQIEERAMMSAPNYHNRGYTYAEVVAMKIRPVGRFER